MIVLRPALHIRCDYYLKQSKQLGILVEACGQIVAMEEGKEGQSLLIAPRLLISLYRIKNNPLDKIAKCSTLLCCPQS